MKTASIGLSRARHDDPTLNDTELRWIVELHDIQSRADTALHELISRFLQASTETRVHIGEVIDQATTGFEEERASIQAQISEATIQLGELHRENLTRRTVSAQPTELASAAPAAPQVTSSLDLREIETSLAQLHAFEAEARAALDPALGREQSPRLVDILILGVSGYKDAASIVRALRQAPWVTETDISQFEPGQLHLRLKVTSTSGLSSQIVAASPIALSVLGTDADGLTFRVIQAS